MANLTCTQRLKVCHLRILRLDDVGEVEVGADSLYEYGAPVLFNYTPTAPERERIEQLDGCGNQCGLYRGGAKAVDGADLTLSLCEQNAEIDELLLGGTVITEGTGAGDSIGYLSATDSTVNEYGVAIELWSYAWAGRQQAIRNGAPGWYRHTFTKASFQLDESAMASDAFGLRAYTGIAEVNSGFGTGLAADPFPMDMGESVYGWFIADEKPDATCGYMAVA